MGNLLEMGVYIRQRIIVLQEKADLLKRQGLWDDHTTPRIRELEKFASQFFIPLDTEILKTNVPPAPPDPFNIE